MELKKAARGAFKCGLLSVSILLIACQGLQVVEPQDRIALLQGGPHAGSWESNDVFLEYQYVWQSGKIELSFSGNAKRGYDQLLVWVLFLDTEGKILETKSGFNSGYRQGSSGKRWYLGSVEKMFELPQQTTHLAFRSWLDLYKGSPPGPQ